MAKDAFREEARFRILRMLERNPDYSQRDLASELGISLGGVNYCLRSLVEKGHVKVRNFRQADNKMRYAYVLTPSGVAERARLTGRFLQRKIREYEALMAEIDSLVNDAEVSDDIAAELASLGRSDR